MVKVMRGGREEIPFIQGKEQRLRFAGAAVKRDPTSKVRETQVRWEVLRRVIRGRHNDTKETITLCLRSMLNCSFAIMLQA